MLDDIIKACRNPKIQWVSTIVILGFVLLLMLFSFDYSIASHFVYPEEEYRLLEEEAEKILSEGTFDSQYVVTIEYRANNDFLLVLLCTSEAKLQMNINNYGDENQSVELHRALYKGSIWFVGTVTLIIHYLLYSASLLLLTIFAFNILEVVCLKIKRRRENQTNI